MRIFQAYTTAVLTFHDLYSMTKQKWVWTEFEAHVQHFHGQLLHFLRVQREFANEVFYNTFLKLILIFH